MYTQITGYIIEAYQQGKTLLKRIIINEKSIINM